MNIFNRKDMERKLQDVYENISTKDEVENIKNCLNNDIIQINNHLTLLQTLYHNNINEMETHLQPLQYQLDYMNKTIDLQLKQIQEIQIAQDNIKSNEFNFITKQDFIYQVNEILTQKNIHRFVTNETIQQSQLQQTRLIRNDIDMNMKQCKDEIHDEVNVIHDIIQQQLKKVDERHK